MNFDKLSEYLEHLPELGIPASEIVISKNGAPVYHKCVGYSDRNGTIPCSDKDLYYLFSATKIVTCIAVMRLVEEGLIGLDDPVAKYIPEYKNIMLKLPDGGTRVAKEMKIWHLFTMTGGMTYDKETDNIKGASDRSTLGMVKAMAKDGLIFDPGTRFKYSLCHDVLAAVAEVVTGMKFRDYIQKVVFDPLGIVDMGFHPTPEQLKRFSDMYSYRDGITKAIWKPTMNAFIFSDDYDSGGAGLFGSAGEYIKIIQAVANGGVAANGYRLLSEESIKMMQKNYLCDDAMDDFSETKRYGYGWGLCGRVHINKLKSQSKSPVGEFGWDGAAGAYALIDPENKLAIFYAQHVGGCAYAYDIIHPTIRNLTYDAIAE